MAGAPEALEKAEHAAHAGHGETKNGKAIGLSMAVMGVLLAICAAFVGAERTELVKTMVEQSNVYNEFQAGDMKYRAAVSQLKMLHAVTPTEKAVADYEKAFEKLVATAKPEAADVLAAIKLSTRELGTMMAPDADEQADFLDVIEKYEVEKDAAFAWGNTFKSAIAGHLKAAESFEKAQLGAEIGIVIASIALLLGSRIFWFVSLIGGGASLAIIIYTFATTHGQVHHAEEAILEGEKSYEKLRHEYHLEDHDAALIAAVRKRLKLPESTTPDKAVPAAAPPAHH